MIKASPTEIRENLEAARAMAQGGINFVAVPILNEQDQLKLIAITQTRLAAMLQKGEENDND